MYVNCDLLLLPVVPSCMSVVIQCFFDFSNYVCGLRLMLVLVSSIMYLSRDLCFSDFYVMYVSSD